MRRGFVIISILHIILVIAFMLIFDYQLVHDSPRYLAAADEFLSFKFQFSPGTNCNTAPGYPIFLAIIKVVTWHNMYAIGLLQSVLFIFSLLYFLNQVRSKYNFPEFCTTVCAGFVLLNPEIIHLNGSVLTESIAASFILLMCGSLIRIIEHRRDGFVFVLSFSFLVITKMEYIFLAIVLLPLLLKFQNLRKVFLITCILLTTFLLLNGFKNLRTFGVFKMTSFGSGTVLYGGNNLNLDGSWHVHGVTKNYIPVKYLPVVDSLNKLSVACACVQLDSLFKSMAKEAWMINATDQLKVIPVKFGKQWLLPGSMDFYTGQEQITGGLQIGELFSDVRWPWYGKWKHGAYLFVYWLCLLISLFGILIKKIYYKLDWLDYILFSILLMNAFMYSVPFYGLGRFHLPVLTCLFYYGIYVCRYYKSKIQNHS